MKFIIFSVLIMLLIYTDSYAGGLIDKALEKSCEGTPLNTVGVNCPSRVPAIALHKLFMDNFPNVSYQKATHDDGEIWSSFGTNEHAYYLKTTKDNKIIGLQQGLERSDCFYKYKIEIGKNGMRYCNAEAPQNVGVACLKIYHSDPIKNPKFERKNCDVFLEAMLGCSKDFESTEKCKKQIYVFMNQKDNDKPIPNIAAKSMPESEAGIADPENRDFRGEPDTGVWNKKGATKAGSK